MYGSLDITTTGLIASRIRMEASTANIAGQDVLLNAAGEYEPFRRRIVMLSPGDPSRNSSVGVHVASIELDESPLKMRYEPGSPYADADGYVGHPNIDIVVEQMNLMIAQRCYEANITAAEATKSMISVALQMLA